MDRVVTSPRNAGIGCTILSGPVALPGRCVRYPAAMSALAEDEL